MQIYTDLDRQPAPFQKCALAIGNFDGVHRGHQAVLRKALEAGMAHRMQAGVLTFEPHPRQYFQPDKPMFRLSPAPYKQELLAAMGLDFMVVLTFDRVLASLSAEAFVNDILVRKLKVGEAVIGHDFHFGRGREGSPQVLKALGAKTGFGVSVVAPEGDGDGTFSSSRIRELLEKGRVREAGELLGHWWRVIGKVDRGAGRGEGLGFPTANIALTPGQRLAHGIYAARVYVDGVAHDAAAYHGSRPTFDDGAPGLEAYLFDYDGDLYGREIEIELRAFLRGDEAFSSAEALSDQMERDCAAARAALAGPDPLAGFAIADRLSGRTPGQRRDGGA